MHWTMLVDTILHSLLFCAHIIIINNLVSVHGDIAKNAAGNKADYIHFDGTKYLVENETYHSEKRMIIEEYFRQSASSAKSSSVKDIYKFHVNMSETTESINSADIVDESQQRHKDEAPSMKSLEVPVTAEAVHVSNNKTDKWKIENPLKWLHNSTSSGSPHHQLYSSNNNHLSNGTLTSKSSYGLHQGKKTDAPMLNLVYDSHIKQRHPDFRLGTHFDEVAIGSLINETVQGGSTAFMNCKINLLQDKTVTWVRKFYFFDTDGMQRHELQLLTVGTNTFIDDTRYSVDFQHPNNFRLSIRNVSKENDEGVYLCQISTHPPKVMQFYLHVNAPDLFIADENLNPLYERHYEVNSTLELYCYVRNIEMTSSVVLWIHNEQVLNYDAIRGGISVRTDLTEVGANSTLSVAKINKFDSGNYTCSIGPTHSFTTTVHVLNESFAELFYHGAGCSVSLIKYQIYTTESFFVLMAFLWSSLKFPYRVVPTQVNDKKPSLKEDEFYKHEYQDIKPDKVPLATNQCKMQITWKFIFRCSVGFVGIFLASS